MNEILDKLNTITLFLLVIVLIASCKEEKVPLPEEPTPQLEILVSPTFNGTTIQTGDIIETEQGYQVEFTTIAFFATDISNGDETTLPHGLFRWGENDNQLVKGEGNADDWATFSANLGVNAIDNHKDPTSFPSDNVLNILIADDMHWNWNPGYIFVKVEAKVDTIPDATLLLDHNVAFHIGKDENLRDLQLGLNWHSVDEYLDRATLKLNMNTFLNNAGSIIDLKDESSSHSEPGKETLTTKVIDNFKAALE